MEPDYDYIIGRGDINNSADWFKATAPNGDKFWIARPVWAIHHWKMLPDGTYFPQYVAHDQAELWHDGEQFFVDAGMVPLLSQLWLKGIRTEYSCQGTPLNNRNAYIKFATAEDLEQFEKMYGTSMMLFLEKDLNIARFNLEVAMVIKAQMEARLKRVG